jgi:hypothetical protein
VADVSGVLKEGSMAYGGADLSTYDPNPSMDDYASVTPGVDYTSIINSAGQWGATIASIATGNRVQTAPVAGGGYQTIGAYGSGYQSNANSQLLIIGVIVVVAILLFRSGK